MQAREQCDDPHTHKSRSIAVKNLTAVGQYKL
jgi:hypothetical protein